MNFVVNIDLRVGKGKGREGGRQKGRDGGHKLLESRDLFFQIQRPRISLDANFYPCCSRSS